MKVCLMFSFSITHIKVFGGLFCPDITGSSMAPLLLIHEVLILLTSHGTLLGLQFNLKISCRFTVQQDNKYFPEVLYC